MDRGKASVEEVPPKIGKRWPTLQCCFPLCETRIYFIIRLITYSDQGSPRTRPHLFYDSGVDQPVGSCGILPELSPPLPAPFSNGGASEGWARGGRTQPPPLLGFIFLATRRGGGATPRCDTAPSRNPTGIPPIPKHPRQPYAPPTETTQIILQHKFHSLSNRFIFFLNATPIFDLYSNQPFPPSGTLVSEADGTEFFSIDFPAGNPPHSGLKKKPEPSQ